ncbi:substrate-binding periplasmic protein [Thalassotalea piscium]|uniref:ABC-type amino acid transport substrate-binding protein n=1 Tax=Thalassotalea piscium TaxID=1230533 RepID=A0A7X0NHN7_9GAMM|nr:ABC transporter substrate-binding protein [Thalassotalea piscium]MBB6543501.1 ABC-type amino acid transport substrate-binding protein [Thalassotalea piscium]
MVIFFKWVIIVLGIFCQAQAYQNPLRIVADDRKLLQYPFEGHAKGPSAEILQLLLEEAELEGEIEFMPWSRVYKTALTRPNTLIMTIIRTPARENKFQWITKVSDTVYSFTSKIASVYDYADTLTIAKKRVTAVVRGSSGYNYLIRKGFSEEENLYLVGSVETAIKLLNNNKIDFVFDTPAVFINYYAQKGLNSDDFVKHHFIQETRKSGYIALSNNSDINLLEKLRKSQKIIEKKAEYKQLIKFRPLISESTR